MNARAISGVFCLAALMTKACLAADLDLVREGVPCARLVEDVDTTRCYDPAFQKMAVEIIQYCLEKSSGTGLPAAKPGDPAEVVRLYVGNGAYARSRVRDFERMELHEFAISFPDNNTILITGRSSLGVYFGALEFVERFLGVKFLMPGLDWEVIPARKTIRVPGVEVRDRPLFLTRCTSFQAGKYVFQWGQRMQGGGQMDGGSHNLSNILPPARFTKTDPEIFPDIRGQRYLPPAGQAVSWQPCFTKPRSVELAAERVNEMLAKWKDPMLPPLCSLGVNDGPGYCECERCRQANGDRLNYMNYPHRSNTYYDWATKVIAKVLEKQPDAWFGCIAYFGIMEPPDNGIVHPRLVPHITFDRFQWIDPVWKEKDQWITEQWSRTVPQIGWYDYTYGSAYLLPRVYPHLMAEYLQWGYEHNVRHLRGESYPNWGEGPKSWVMARLRWNPYQNVDLLIREWCEAAVGKEAAPYLVDYYRRLEEIWTKRMTHSSWWRNAGVVYLPAAPYEYLDVVTAGDVELCRHLMKEVEAKAGTAAEKKRAVFLADTFRFWESAAVCFLGDQEALNRPILLKEQAVGAVPKAAELLRLDVRKHELNAYFTSHPECPFEVIPDYCFCWGDGFGSVQLWKLVDWVRREPLVRQLIESEAKAEGAENALFRTHAQLLLGIADGRVKPVSENPDFGKGAAGWDLLNISERGEPEGWFASLTEGHPVSGGVLVWDLVEGHEGKGCVMMSRTTRTQVRQSVPAKEPGLYLALGFVKVERPAGETADITVKLEITLRQPNQGVECGTYYASCRPPVFGEWIPMSVVFRVAPSGHNWQAAMPKDIVLKVEIKGGRNFAKAWVDDVAVYRLGPIPRYEQPAGK